MHCEANSTQLQVYSKLSPLEAIILLHIHALHKRLVARLIEVMSWGPKAYIWGFMAKPAIVK